VPKLNVTSIWTFDIGIFRHQWLVAGLFLAACEGGFALLQPAARIVVADGSVVIAGPAGYCVNRTASKDTSDGAFVLLGSCASIGNNASLTAPLIAGALTASVSVISGADIDASLARLGAFFSSNQGRAALARDGNAASAQVLSTRNSRGAFIMKVQDTSPGAVSGLAPDYWRAVFDIRGRIVTLSVNAFQNKPISDAEGFAILAAFVAQVRRENPALVDPVGDPV